MLTDEELWEKCQTNQPITLEDIGIPSWLRDCDGFYYELESLICRSGIAYHHKDGYRWSDGTFLSKRECKHYRLDPGIKNVKVPILMCKEKAVTKTVLRKYFAKLESELRR